MHSDLAIVSLAAEPSPLDRLRLLHRRQRGLCDLLEALADALPAIRPQACLEAAWAITTLIGPLQALEESAFFPLLRRRLGSSTTIATSIGTSCFEHVEDRDAALDLVVSLKRLAEGCSRQEIDLVSYQLRAFFMAIRRHEAREIEVLFPQAAEAFTAEDQAVLLAALTSGPGAGWPAGTDTGAPFQFQFPDT